jgi:uncharacterized membrane protein YqjE
MRTPATERGVGAAAKEVADHARTLAALEVELAKLELRGKVTSLGTGAALAGVATALAVFAFGFLLAALATALATTMATWLALVLVGVTLLVVALALLTFAVRAFKRGAPPVPEQAIEEARRTTETLRADGGR